MAAPTAIGLRWAGAASGAAVATLALLLTVQALIAPHEHGADAHREVLRVELLRVPPETELRTRRRQLPKPPPPTPAARTPAAPRAATLKLATPAVDPRLAGVEVDSLPTSSLEIGTGPGGLLGDLDVVPLVRVPPEYPPRAAQRGIGGWVLLSFTVTASGAVTDVSVVDAEPEGLFERAAVRAAKRFKYRPRMRDGAPVDRPGVELLLRFEPNAS